MADGFDVNDVDYLRQVDRVTGAVTPATPAAAGTQSIEGMTWSLDFLRLYARERQPIRYARHDHRPLLGQGEYHRQPADPMQGEFGAITVADVDGRASTRPPALCMACTAAKDDAQYTARRVDQD